MAAGNGKIEAANRVFRPKLYMAQVLMDHARRLECLAASLRRTEGKMGASSLAIWSARGRIWIFAWRRDGERQVRGVSRATELRKIFRR
jgi:hypothetical protein